MYEKLYIKKLITKKLLEAEEDDEDIFSDEDLEDLDDTEDDSGDEDTEEDENIDDLEDEGTEDSEEDEFDTSEEDTDEQDYSSDEEKVNAMFKDVGDPEIDYSLTNENNVRLYTFKFKNAGMDPFTLMTEIEKVQGLRADDLEARLTPYQFEIYKEKNSELRNKYKLIKNREKNIIIYNANISFFINDENGDPKRLTKTADVNQAIKKVTDYMDRNFGDDWVDNKDSIEFLQNIKINFSETNKIRPNLISVEFFQGDNDRLIPFNQMYSEIPSVVDKFIKENQENDIYKTSSIFRTLVDDFVGRGVGGSRISVYPIIRMSSGSIETPDVSSGSEEDEEGDFGGGSGGSGGDFGGDLGGDDDLGDFGSEEEADEDLGDDTTGDEDEEI